MKIYCSPMRIIAGTALNSKRNAEAEPKLGCSRSIANRTEINNYYSSWHYQCSCIHICRKYLTGYGLTIQFNKFGDDSAKPQQFESSMAYAYKVWHGGCMWSARSM